MKVKALFDDYLSEIAVLISCRVHGQAKTERDERRARCCDVNVKMSSLPCSVLWTTRLQSEQVQRLDDKYNSIPIITTVLTVKSTSANHDVNWRT